MQRGGGHASPLFFAAVPAVLKANFSGIAKRNVQNVPFSRDFKEIAKNPPLGDKKYAENVSNSTIDNFALN